jgi:hypothetical protein
MALNPQQRSLAILGGVFGGGLLIAFLAVSLISGDDNKDRRVAIDPDQPSTSTSTTTLTLPPTLPTTLATVPVPPNPPVTPGTITPGTVIVTPTSPPPTSGTTSPPPTSGTTSPPTVADQLEAVLEDALLGGEEPDPGADPRVRVFYDTADEEFVRVSWDLDPTLSEDEQKYAAREEATVLLRAIKAFSGLDDERVILRAFVPDPDDPPDGTIRVVRLEFERATLDAIDFDTVDPLTIFELADEKDIDSSLEPAPPPTTSTSSTTTTT